MRNPLARADAPHPHGHGLGHSHGGPPASVTASRTAVRIALPALLVVALLTGLGLALMWPDSDRATQIAKQVPFADPSSIFAEGEVVSVEPGCAGPGAATGSACTTIGVGLTTGPDRGQVVDVSARGSLAASGLQPRDHVQLLGAPIVTAPGTEAGAQHSPPGTRTASPGSTAGSRSSCSRCCSSR
ncbi:hypothetical protein AB3K78_01450 [Leucobacter sp. HNU]|uniref:hypothetical protein n=1 Tax=Leucobacter sp. HNU TaxID=3236805 RepID=UPI003A808DCF